MKIIFMLSEDVHILDFILVDYEEIIEKHIYSEVLAMGALRNSKCFVDASSFRELLKYYMGGNGTLEEYLDHIEKHGFYTPYQPNLCIRVQRFNIV